MLIYLLHGGPHHATFSSQLENLNSANGLYYPRVSIIKIAMLEIFIPDKILTPKPSRRL
jgi:hypothetical protein